MKTIGPELTLWKKFGNLIIIFGLVIVMLLLATVVLNATNRSMLYIGMGGYALLVITMMFRKMASSVVVSTSEKKVTINTYNVFTTESIQIPIADLEVELYANKLSIKKKPGILFFQKGAFKFYLTLNQPGWKQELLQEVYDALKEAKVKEKK